MADGYSRHGAVTRTLGVEHLICWAHARRGFVETVKVQANGKRGRADEAIERIGQLYRIERECKDVSVQARYAVRQTRSLSVLA